jgi:2-dehydropantoate 2-reductase
MYNTQFAVFGAGGAGGYFGAVLARTGYSVTFIARGAHLEAMRRDGLHISSPQGDFVVNAAQVSDNPADVGVVDAVILGVKAWQVLDAAKTIRPLLAPGTKVLPLQNGVEAADQLQQALGRQHTLIGLCRIISSITSPGHICHAGGVPTVMLGEPDGLPLSVNARKLTDALLAAGVVTMTPQDIQAALWEKLVAIAAFSGAGAVTRATIGEVRQCPPSLRMLQQLMEESVAVARTRGIKVCDDAVARTIAFIESLPASGTASMQRDIANGKPSELEEIIGAVVRFGDQTGVATPVMDFVYASLLPQELRARKNVFLSH